MNKVKRKEIKDLIYDLVVIMKTSENTLENDMGFCRLIKFLDGLKNEP